MVPSQHCGFDVLFDGCLDANEERASAHSGLGPTLWLTSGIRIIWNVYTTFAVIYIRDVTVCTNQSRLIMKRDKPYSLQNLVNEIQKSTAKAKPMPTDHLCAAIIS